MLNITTTHEIVSNHMDPESGSLVIKIFINGEPGQSTTFMSGNIHDIRQFVAGEIDSEEIARRWGMFGSLHFPHL